MTSGQNMPGAALASDGQAAGPRAAVVTRALIDTEMADWIRHDEEAIARFSSSIPAGRMGTPEEIGSVAFPASDAGRYRHGAVVMVDGGVTA